MEFRVTFCRKKDPCLWRGKGCGSGEKSGGSITVCTAGPGDLRDRLRGRICGDRRKNTDHRRSPVRIRRSLSERLKTIALPEDAGILSAVLFGEKEDLDSAVYELYRKNGISHLLAISGLHVSIVGLGIWKIFRKGGAGFWFAGVGAGGFLCVYGMMVAPVPLWYGRSRWRCSPFWRRLLGGPTIFRRRCAFRLWDSCSLILFF